MVSPDATRASGPARPASQAIQAPRLLASDPRIDNLPHVELAERAPVPRAAAAAGPVAPPRKPVGVELRVQPAPASAPAASPYDRIAALSAVPVGDPPPTRQVQAMTAIEMAQSWGDIALDYVRAYWRQIGLVSAMVLAAGLLFWRLGERSRHAEQELVLTVRARLEELEEEPSAAAMEAALRGEDDPAGDDFADDAMLPAAPVIHRALEGEGDEYLLDEPQPIVRPPRVRHATLREAIQAMKAETAARPPVEA